MDQDKKEDLIAAAIYIYCALALVSVAILFVAAVAMLFTGDIFEHTPLSQYPIWFKVPLITTAVLVLGAAIAVLIFFWVLIWQDLKTELAVKRTELALKLRQRVYKRKTKKA